MQPVETLTSKLVFEGKAFNLRQDRIRLPDGRDTLMDIVDHRGAVTIVPLDQEGQLWFIRQYRHAIHQHLLELPAGVMEENETPLETAQRELREEIGMAAAKIEAIGSFYLAPGYSSEVMHVFLATGLYPAPLPADENEWLSVEKIPLPQALVWAETAQIQDSKSLVALSWVRRLLAPSGASAQTAG